MSSAVIEPRCVADKNSRPAEIAKVNKSKKSLPPSKALNNGEYGLLNV